MERKPNPFVYPSYIRWIGQQVILRIGVANLGFPVRGVILGESHDSVRVRVGEGWDISIYKGVIRAVESSEDSRVN